MSDATDTSAKAAMRMHLRNARRAFVKDYPEADWQAGDLAETLVTRLARKPGVAAVYKASGSEMDARPLAEQLIKLGWRIALPYSDLLDAPVVFRAWKPGDRLAPDAVGVAAPLVSAPELEPEIIIAPLIGFDRHGGRLGQGGGYYDRTLEALRKKPKPPAFVGLAFSVQEVERVPLEPHDQRLDAILTEKEFIAVRKDV